MLCTMTSFCAMIPFMFVKLEDTFLYVLKSLKDTFTNFLKVNGSFFVVLRYTYRYSFFLNTS